MSFPSRWLLISTLAISIMVSAPAWALPSLQRLINLTPPGQTLRPPPGTYAGPVIIRDGIILDGQDQVIIDARKSGTVLTVLADDTVVRNIRLTGSGHSHDQVDAGILIKANNVLLENTTIDNVLFGVHISQGNGNTVRGNTISSRAGDPTLRGEGVRLWYSTDNIVADNQIFLVRDLVFTNSPGNILTGNTVQNSRMALELVFSPHNEISHNHFHNNDHGIVGIYSDSLHIHHNRIEHQDNLLGSALAVKGSSQILIEENEILNCAIGLTANSPIFPENILYLYNNKFAFNDVAMYFYGDKGGHIIKGNHFFNNFQQVAVTAPTSAIDNTWQGNTWQDYQGFDRDGDGIGDVPYELILFSDRIWMERPMARFFRGSPVLELIDFVERLAPFAEPDVILRDPEPRLK